MELHLTGYGGNELSVYEERVLCPERGLERVQFTVEVKDTDGKLINTTKLPKCSLRRGYNTTLTGPLFSGKASDWKVSQTPIE